MVEFTQREKILIHTMNVMNNPAYSNAPFDLKTNALKAQLLVCGYEFQEDQMTDLMNGIGAEVEEANHGALKLLDKYKTLFKDLKRLH